MTTRTSRLSRLRRIWMPIVALSLLLASCGSETGTGGGLAPLLANRSGSDTVTRGDAATQNFMTALEQGGGGVRRLGTDDFIGSTANGRDLVEAGNNGDFLLNLVDVPIEKAAQAVLGNALKKNYTIDPDVRGTVTVQTTRAMSERDLLETFQTALELNGATLQTGANGLITITRLSGAARRVTGPGGLEIGARVVAMPLQYVGTEEMVRLLQPIVGESVTLSQIPNRNILMISGTRDEINAAIDAANLFDVDVLKGKSVGLFPLHAAEPEAVVEQLSTIFETEEGGSLQNVVQFIPSTRLGAVLVISTRAKYLDKAESWIRNLDRTAGGTRRRPVIYNLQNRSAVDLAPVLKNMLGEVTYETGGPAAETGTARVVADDTRNAIIAWGNDTEQETFARLIRSLDSAPVQVLLETTIAEVSLNDELKFGLRWFFEKGNFSANFSDSPSGSVGPSFPGLSLLFQGLPVSVALNALNSVTTVNVVSSPSLMVVDNEQAELQIGDEVPIATQQVRDTTNANAPVVNTISFRNTGIILSVKPRVSSSGQVVLDIEQEVSSVQNTTTSGIDSPTIAQRRIKTSVVVGDGQTLALGGLIQQGHNQTSGKVPGVGDIPVIGALFRNRTDSVERTELLVLITPRVIRNSNESRAVTDELRQRISGADGLVRNGVGQPNVAHRIID